MKLQIMMIIIIPIENAEMMLTDWILLIELSENTRAIGSTISRMYQSNVTMVCGCSFSPSFLYYNLKSRNNYTYVSLY